MHHDQTQAATTKPKQQQRQKPQISRMFWNGIIKIREIDVPGSAWLELRAIVVPLSRSVI